ncbi:Chitin-binding type-2 domain-containing protein [Meloidogyne graminicola]|uniref:Chitin-binding type-2 domain-containing protein n=1 Tax=Meloidogyne graminicola TaxID=189291 RepID=A0A8S9ZUY4_9BILA|nr:Chitin-binding type-2 domain-containing protein [Meloidogyne graminicola]
MDSQKNKGKIYSNLLNEVVIVSKSESSIPNYCNNSQLIQQSGLIRAPMGQFLGFPCSNEFYHCRWQSDGYRTHRKNCRAGLVYDVIGTQNCNYDYNVKGCSTGTGDNYSVTLNCTNKDFKCPLSEDCVPLSKRCDGNYDCVLEEDEQNCPMCKSIHFPCVVSEQCIPIGQRCNGIKECKDGTDELDCENCGSGKFFCRKSGKCISAKERCDGYSQCPHGEDEQLCKKSRNVFSPNMFICESGTQQISQKQVCDGIVHCTYDGSDEKYCQRSTGFERPRNEIEFETNLPVQTKEPGQLGNENEIIKTGRNSKIAFDQPPQLTLQGFQSEKERVPHINSIAFEFEQPKGKEKVKDSEIIIPGGSETDIWNESQLNGKDLISNLERLEDNKNLTQQEQIEQNNLVIVQEQEKPFLPNEEILNTNIETTPFIQQVKDNKSLVEDEKENKEEIEKCQVTVKNIKTDLNEQSNNKSKCLEEERKFEFSTTELPLNTTNNIGINEELNNSLLNNFNNTITKIKKQLNPIMLSEKITKFENNENNEENNILKNVAEKLEKMTFFGEGNDEFKINSKNEENVGQKLNIVQQQKSNEKSEDEEEEQRQILKRLYSKYGRRRTNLYNHFLYFYKSFFVGRFAKPTGKFTFAIFYLYLTAISQEKH